MNQFIQNETQIFAYYATKPMNTTQWLVLKEHELLNEFNNNVLYMEFEPEAIEIQKYKTV